MWCGRVNIMAFVQIANKSLYINFYIKQVTCQIGLAGYLSDFKGFFALAQILKEILWRKIHTDGSREILN